MTLDQIKRMACDCAGPEYHQTGNAACAISILLAAEGRPVNAPTNAQDAEEKVYYAYEAARRLRLKHIVDHVDFDVVIAGLCAARRFIFYSYSLPAQNETNWAGRKNEPGE